LVESRSYTQHLLPGGRRTGSKVTPGRMAGPAATGLAGTPADVEALG